MPGRGFPIDSVSSDFDYSPYGFAFPRHPRRTLPVEEPPPRRRPRRTHGGRDEIASLLQEIMTTPENSGFEALSDDDDDLVEIVSARPSRPTSTVPTPFVLPLPGSRPLSSMGASAPRRRPHAFTPQPPRTLEQENAIIDLTEEPDSPVERKHHARLADELHRSDRRRRRRRADEQHHNRPQQRAAPTQQPEPPAPSTAAASRRHGPQRPPRRL
ncbi:hypothetical protein PWT90_11263 [Aphanocladium album]|nr:hypothetical protein PWT90_11263 [Aphanocladium album]